ncbi:hypothetical protein ACVINY_001806 [Sinorhizobium meliloti]
MVAAERQQVGARLQDFRRLALDGLGSPRMVAVVEQAIAVIDRRHVGKQVTLERILRIVVEDRRCTADRLRPEACAGAIRRGCIERNSPDDRLHTLELLGVFPPHEGKDAGMRRIGGRRRQ